MSVLSRVARKLYALPARERILLAQASLLLPLVHALQQSVPFRRWRPLLTRLRPPRSLGLPLRARAAPTPEEIARAVERARRGIPGEYKCLPAAYTAHLLLRAHGYAAAIQVGVARDQEGRVEAHAWVELDGRILVGELPDLGRFVPLPPLAV